MNSLDLVECSVAIDVERGDSSGDLWRCGLPWLLCVMREQ